MRELLDLFRVEIVAIKIHHSIAIGVKVNTVAIPHRKSVCGVGVRHLVILVVLQVVDRNELLPAAAVTLPGTKLRGDAVVGNLRPVRRV